MQDPLAALWLPPDLIGQGRKISPFGIVGACTSGPSKYDFKVLLTDTGFRNLVKYRIL